MKTKLFYILPISLCMMTTLYAQTKSEASLDDGMSAARAALTTSKSEKSKTSVTNSETVITADLMEYNYKEAVTIMTGSVVVTDPRFSLTANKLFVFFKGTNELDQLVVVGDVKVVNDNRTAVCDKAVFQKEKSMLTMVGKASISTKDSEGKVSTINGDKITIWTNDERLEVYPNPKLTIPLNSKNSTGLNILK